MNREERSKRKFHKCTKTKKPVHIPCIRPGISVA
jgi:hypothetical protein